MAITAQDALTRADYLLQQAGVTENARRWAQAQMFLHVRDGQTEIIKAIPEASSAVVTLTYTEGARQTLAADYQGLIRIHGLTPFDRSILDVYDPDWESATGSTPTQYAYEPDGDSRTWYVNPPATASNTVTATVSKSAQAVTEAADALVIHDRWLHALALFCAHKAMSVQSDYANAGLSASFLAQFLVSIGAAPGQ